MRLLSYKKLGRKRPSFLTDTISPARETRADGDPRGAGARPLGNPSALTPPQAGEIAFFKAEVFHCTIVLATYMLRSLNEAIQQ